MFYNIQKTDNKQKYINLLKKLGSLSNLFSDSATPMLYYRAHENAFCKAFDADNLARHDCSADAKKGSVGIGLKTWVGGNNQKVAEFGKLRKQLEGLSDDELVRKVSEYRNSRIDTTMRMYNLTQMVYHVVIRSEGKMKIYECSFDRIDIDNIKRLTKRDGANTRYFTDGKHIYNFNIAKTTLYMLFEDLIELDEIPVKVFDDPFRALDSLDTSEIFAKKNRQLALRLYSDKQGVCKVEAKSGLNIWNAGGRKRHPNEVYIPFNKADRDRPENKEFFPCQDTCFDLELPDGKHISAKVCQQDGKAIMSNPNKDLGQWLLRDVLQLPENTLVTYELLQEKGFDTVVFEKIDELKYKIDFTTVDAYNRLYNLEEKYKSDAE